MKALIDADGNRLTDSAYKEYKAQISRIWYANHRLDPKWLSERYAKGRLARRQVKEKAIKLLGGSCNDCNNIYHPSAMDFHHIEPDGKDFSIGKSMSWSARTIAELKKCILLCANCHRIRHFKEDI